MNYRPLPLFLALAAGCGYNGINPVIDADNNGNPRKIECQKTDFRGNFAYRVAVTVHARDGSTIRDTYIDIGPNDSLDVYTHDHVEARVRMVDTRLVGDTGKTSTTLFRYSDDGKLLQRLFEAYRGLCFQNKF